MRRIIQFSLNNKFALWLMTIIVIVAGLYSSVNMKMETLPSITPPVMTISAVDPGATPEEVADKVTKPIEQAIQNQPGVKTVTSNSYKNTSSIQVEYEFSTDLDQAEDKLKDAVSKIDYPDNVETPTINRLSLDAFPILTFSVSQSDHQSLEKLTQTVDKQIVPKLEGVEGVSSVDVSGKEVKEIDLSFDKKALDKYGLDEETVINTIKSDNASVPLGLYTFGDTQQSVVINGQATTLKDLKNLEIPVQAMAGQQGAGQQAGTQGAAAGQAVPPSSQQSTIQLPTVKLSELADVKMVGKADSISRTNGKPSIAVQIVKASDANTVDVANGINDQMEKVKKDFPNLKVINTLDQAQPIKDSVNAMIEKAVLGAIFAMLIILLFLRNIKSTIISVVSIPLSLLIAMIILKQMDITLNIMTLGAMTVAIGRVVDDSIVVIENIYRRLSLTGEKLKGKELIIAATREMFIPIMSSTIVTIAVFLPLGFVTGMIGQLFLPFALTIVFALLASLLVAITIVPMLAHSLFKNGLKEKAKRDDARPSRFALGYRGFLNWTLNHKWITSIIAVLLLVGSFTLVPFIGVSFIPSDEQKMMAITYNPDPGQTQADVEKVGTQAESYFDSRKHVKVIQYSIGGGNPLSQNENQALFYIQYDDDTPHFDKEQDTVLKHLKKSVSKGDWGTVDISSSGSSNQVTMYVYGDNIDEIKPTIEKIQGVMKANSHLKNVDSSLSKNYVEYTFGVDQDKLSALGLTTAQVAAAFTQNSQRDAITTVKKGNEDINVYLASDESNYQTIDDLAKTKIKTPSGNSVALSDITDRDKGQTSDTITRRNGQIYASVSGDITSKDVSKVTADVKKKVDKIDLPSGVSVSMGGVSEDINTTFTQLGLAMLAAIAIVYLILVITFGSAGTPFVILLSLPFVLIGAFLALFISGETISVSVMIGALMLIGIVITNAIVLIDRVIHKEKEGISTREALLEAGVTRLRPILMTAIATICALLPLAFGLEGGALISKGLGITVIGGLASSTLLTLVVVPIVYELFAWRRIRKWKREHEVK
ncbi:swarming motility protein SwrC [Pullulanibacillus camelliae]|uniref:Swarming motility protein SwrC n=1 Tax=Pullulanibacillus camelliae TaxID=1707096 RepID=A0A8J2VS25_9BACL|nr:efflux RND transporter permease subunit [Pullulanibacillus camelliae]GGE36878.1 swarming motility protein SwrC [Pullulanibacillus camelliae]